MGTVALGVLSAAVARLRARPLIVSNVESIRLDHRTPVERDDAPAVHVIAIADRPEAGSKCYARTLDFRVVASVRDDAGSEALDELLRAVLERLDPRTTETASAIALEAYPAGARLRMTRIRFDQVVADGDVHEAAIELEADYVATDEWNLE